MNDPKPNLTPTEVQKRLHRGLLLEYASIGWMSVEDVAAVLAGVLAGSLALLAFGGDSFIELLSAHAVANYLRRRERGKADSEILQKTERITGVLLVVLTPTIGLGAVYSYITGVRAETSIFGIIVAIGAVLMMPGLWLGKKRIGKETKCLPLSIDAVESATCFLMSIALLGGLLGVYLFGLWWVDYLATGIILAFVAKEAIEAFGESRDGQNDSGP
ncbi:MAG TPA: cation transporter [Candidatus Angelobacter sp.]|nr:cation transporter [Candidatus Angelobacter sp.]